MGRGQEYESPKGQENEGETAERAPGEAASALAAPAHDEQSKIEQPDGNGPEDDGVALEIDAVLLLHEHGVKRQAGGEENETGGDEAAGDFFQALDGREQGKYGAEF